MCDTHGDKHFDKCVEQEGNFFLNKNNKPVPYICKILPLRTYLAKRGRLVTGKTL